MLKETALPVLLTANAAAWGYTIATGGDLESVLFTTFLGSMGALALLEVARPHRASWRPSPREWLRDLSYFGLNGLVDAGTKLGAALLAVSFAPGSNGLPLWLDIIAAVLVTDLAGYWVHRWGHVGWLWRVHGVHHTPDKVNLVNNNTANFINIMLSTLSTLLPALLIGASPEATLVAAGLGTLQSFIVHVNAELTLPAPLDRIFMTPAHHRLHHSTVLEEAGNYASVLTVWDWMFGTLVYAPGLEPEAVGVVEPESFPAPSDILRNVIHPFVRRDHYDHGSPSPGADEAPRVAG